MTQFLHQTFLIKFFWDTLPGLLIIQLLTWGNICGGTYLGEITLEVHLANYFKIDNLP